MNETEALLTSAFWKLLEEKPYKKITVRDIVDRCQVNRNTFYYHFEGIPSLLMRALSLWSEEILSDTQYTERPLLTLIPLADACRNHRSAILNLRNSRAWEESVLPLVEDYCRKAAAIWVSGMPGRTPSGERLTSEDKALLSRFLKSAAFGCITDWVDSGMQTDLSAEILRVLKITGQDSDSSVRKQG